jgi:hypothetical protein
MSTPRFRIRPRSAIADPDLARVATVDLPGTASSTRRVRRPSGLMQRFAGLRRPVEPERVIVMTLAPARVRQR